MKNHCAKRQWKKYILGMLLMLSSMLTACTTGTNQEVTTSQEATESEIVDSGTETTEAWSIDNLKKQVETAIEAHKQFKAEVKSKEAGKDAIRQYGVKQRALYENPTVEAIELEMEQTFGLLAVNLGEIEEQTAKDIRDAFSYVYDKYPWIRDSLTNISLCNFESAKSTYVAVTQSREFMMKDAGEYPYVVKYEIILNAAKFMNREQLLKDCDILVASGQRCENTNITSIVVHELGHQLTNVYAMKEFGLTDAYYITEDNAEAYSRYVTNQLKTNQIIEQSILESAYALWQSEYQQSGSEEDFRGSISGYAKGVQEDGGISYGETIAEAIADIYLNGDHAADASKAIEAVLKEKMKD